MKIVRISLASATCAALIGGVLFLPRSSFASGVKKVAKAFQSFGHYHVKSYMVGDGQRKLSSETWVDGANRKVVLYGPDGKPMPNIPGLTDVVEKLNSFFQNAKPEELLDPAIKAKIGKELGDDVKFGSTSVEQKIYINGQETKDVPVDIQKMIRNAESSSSKLVFSVGGGASDVSYLSTMLKDERLWDIKPSQSLNGKTVDVYRVKGAQSGVVLYVDPTTSLPVRLDMTTDLFGRSTTFEDDFDYTKAVP